MKATIEHPKVFISYAWGDKDNQQRVLSFATSLMRAGIDVLLDKWDLKEGNDKYTYMERSVTDNTVTNVLLLLDKNYTEKADSRKGGVGDETQIISAEIYGKVAQTKFIPIVFSKDEDGNIAKPAYLKSTLHVDLSDPDTYEHNYQYLVKLLYGVEIYQKPQLGSKPFFVENDTVIPSHQILELDSIRKQTNPIIQRVNFQNHLNQLRESITSIDIKIPQGENFSSECLSAYYRTIEKRDLYLKLLEVSPFVPNSVEEIVDFLEETYASIDAIQGGRKGILLTFIQEIFIYTITFYLKTKQYDEIGFMLGHAYYKTHYENSAHPFSLFYNTQFQHLNTAINKRDNKNYLSGVAKLWSENINISFCALSDFVLADSICFHYMFLGDNHINGIHWFPKMYIYDSQYDSSVMKFANKLKSKYELSKIIKIFNTKDINEFIRKYKDVENEYKNGQMREWRYLNSFDSPCMFFDCVKSEELGIYR